MRICWTGTFDPEFERNKRLREYLTSAEVDFTEIRCRLWPEDRVAAFTSERLSTAFRMPLAYTWLLLKLLMSRRPDVYLLSYPGWFDLPVVKLVGLIKRRPVVFDIFISLHDTAISDRGLASKRSPTALMARTIDRLAIRLSDRVIADTRAHARFLAEFAEVDQDRFGVVFLGADEAVFAPADGANIEDDSLIVFHGTFVPLQGVEWIVRAAALVGPEFRFRLIGHGQTKAQAETLASRLSAPNIEFIDFIPQEQLVEQLRRAALCLGIFGVGDKAERVVPHKVYEALACGRPVLTRASSAVAEVLGSDEVATCSAGDDRALAAAILELMNDPERRQRMARAARSSFRRTFSVGPQGRRLLNEFDIAAGSTRRP